MGLLCFTATHNSFSVSCEDMCQVIGLNIRTVSINF